ncbi:MAG: HEPN domain-containing protein, partial [Nanoarchaeota archaeon]|nr:HEPN domain-containing protein [Nanoarchaeota archaeon]
MSFEKLLNEEKIEKVTKTEFNAEPAEKSIVFAKKGLELQNYDEIMSIVYNGIFKISNRLMNFLGYRAIGKEHHKNVFEFLREITINQALVNYFDNIRKKRNDFIYRDIECILKEEAEEIIKKAGEFVQEIRTFVQEIRTREKSENKVKKKEVALKNKKV